MKDLNEKIKVLEDNTNITSLNEKIIKLMEEIKEKENEIKELKLAFPFELKKDEKLISVIFISLDQKIHYSLICKNKDKFNILENLLYEKFPEYQESENYFMANGKKINRFKTLEENKIGNSDLIHLFKIEE